MRQFQVTVGAWLERCFGPAIAHDRAERTHRFTEEALELAQATGCSKSEVLQLVDYVYSRPVGDVQQEVGGVTVTLAALCYARRFSLAEAAYAELHRIHQPSVMARIAAKQAAKPKVGPLPAETQADKETSAFEAWVERNCPSGDVTQVQDQWEASAEYLELQPEPRAPGWRCFHCGELFTSPGPAQVHFGPTEHSKPACQIDAAEYRAMEERMRRYNEEDSDLHREVHRAHNKGVEGAKRAEEAGYARGLKDAGRPAYTDVSQAPAALNLNDKAFWVLGWNAALDAHPSQTTNKGTDYDQHP